MEEGKRMTEAEEVCLQRLLFHTPGWEAGFVLLQGKQHAEKQEVRGPAHPR